MLPSVEQTANLLRVPLFDVRELLHLSNLIIVRGYLLNLEIVILQGLLRHPQVYHLALLNLNYPIVEHLIHFIEHHLSLLSGSLAPHISVPIINS